MIILVAAMSRGRVIGKDGDLPWGHGSMKHDQKRYRELIDGRTLAIGSGTFNPDDDYIKAAKHVYLLTRKHIKSTGHITPVSSLEPIIEAAKTEEVYVVGGAGVFAEFIDYADKLELTYIDADYHGDRFFPEFDESEWRVADEETHPADADNLHPYKFVTLVKK